ncbi:MAG: histidine phosphatase family protein [Porticoccaceae bacterium]|nr:histidine phosphatase family protein [Porticoccaceae bacterium]
MSELILLRHGQAAFGNEHYDQLSTLGEAQARATGDFLQARKWQFDRVITGPRQRQRLTATLAARVTDSELHEDLRLDEFAEGSQILAAAEQRAGGPLENKKARLRAYMQEIRLWCNGDITIDGTASASDFCRTVDDWLESVTADPAPGQQLLAVTSAGVIAAVLCRVLNQPREAIADWMAVLGNASLTTLMFSRGRLSVREINSNGHLPVELLSGI